MPIYEFICPVCGFETTSWQKFDDPFPKCEECKEDDVEMVKQISLSSFRLKGGGWYKDGYSKGVKK